MVSVMYNIGKARVIDDEQKEIAVLIMGIAAVRGAREGNAVSGKRRWVTFILMRNFVCLERG